VPRAAFPESPASTVWRQDIRPLSFTQISLYRSCPLSYKLQYIDGLKPKDRWYFSFGSTLHSCVERFFKVSTPPPPSLEELLRFYDRSWLSEGYTSPEEEKRYRDFGREILTGFWNIHQADFRIPVALEKGFYLDIDGVKLRGFMDRVDKLESGGLAVIDYKSNRELFTAGYLAEDLQLTIYQMAAEQTWRLPVERLTLYHLRSNTPCSCPPRGRAQLEQTRRLVLEVAENIARGNFPATENEYCPCDFPEHCPYYRHKYAASAPPTAAQELLPGMAAANAVERYAGLQAQIKDLQVQLEETKQCLIDFCCQQGLNRVFGDEHEITYKLIERSGYAEQDVRAVLEPAGLWEKVLGLDPARLKELLTAAGTPAAVKSQIQALKHVTSSYPQLYLKKSAGEEE
jgi:putative RecB family exonuclease